MKYATMKLRLFANSVLNNDGCHVWTARKDRYGYGRINIRVDGKHKTLKVHRVAFEEYVRPLEYWEEVDHLCYNKLCINPDHHQAVSKTENYKRRRNYNDPIGINPFAAWIEMIDNMEAI